MEGVAGGSVRQITGVAVLVGVGVSVAVGDGVSVGVGVAVGGGLHSTVKPETFGLTKLVSAKKNTLPEGLSAKSTRRIRLLCDWPGVWPFSEQLKVTFTNDVFWKLTGNGGKKAV